MPPQRGPRPKGRRPQRPQPAPPVAAAPAPAVAVVEGRPPIVIPKSIPVGELAKLLETNVVDVIRTLVNLGLMVSINQTIDFETATLVATELGIETKPEEEAAPAATEDTKVTFLDTPGHEAFTAMRARGAQLTDVAVLVVAADDGVQPQTVEAISHVKAAGVPMVVALNKMDRPDANPDQVKAQLAEHNVTIEEYGGDVPLVPVSARTKMGIDDLLEVVMLVADVAELTANPDRPAIGRVIEAHLDTRRGPVATVLVQTGTLERGDLVVAGTTYGRVRAMTDDKGKNVGRAEPARPVEILGLPDVPEAGDVFRAVPDEQTAKALVAAN